MSLLAVEMKLAGILMLKFNHVVIKILRKFNKHHKKEERVEYTFNVCLFRVISYVMSRVYWNK